MLKSVEVVKMGYYTYFSGEISLEGVHPRVVEAIRAMLKKEGEGGVSVEEDGICIDTEWKNYHSEMETLLYQIAQLLPDTAAGKVRCTGEDSDDRWLIAVEGNRVYRVRVEWQYDHANRQEFTPEVAERERSASETAVNGQNAGEAWDLQA
jgi:hypothetical protein